MYRLKLTHFTSVIFLILLSQNGCQTFLDEKPDKKLAVPITPEHFQAVLNESSQVNISAPEGEVAAGDYYLTDDFFAGMECEDAWDYYLWQDSPFTVKCEGEGGLPNGYKTIYFSNVVLDGIRQQFGEGVTDSRYNNVRGQAYFHRAINLLEMAGIWCNAYEKNTASNELGLPLRLNPDFNEKSVRSNLEETYQQIVSDLISAIKYLPENQATKWWPSKVAAYGFLARTYLLMRDYENALLFADSCLTLSPVLLDYKNFDKSQEYFDQEGNGEVIYAKLLLYYYSLYIPEVKVNPDLYNLYAEGDIRKTFFFNANADGSYRFKGNYLGNRDQFFSGVATDEVYLIRAECLARTGKISAAMDDLNTLLKARWDHTFVQMEADNEEEALQIILSERRKELLFRGLRWPDIKRLNMEGANISLKRIIDGQTYTLPANDPRFAILIPEDIINFSGMEQNRR